MKVMKVMKVMKENDQIITYYLSRKKMKKNFVN